MGHWAPICPQWSALMTSAGPHPAPGRQTLLFLQPLAKPLFFSTHGNILKQVLHPLFTLLSGAKMCADIQHLWSPDLAGSRRGRKIRLECAGCSQSPLLRWQERSGCDSSAYGSCINPTHSPLRLGESCSEKLKSWQFISRVVTAFLYSTVRSLSFVTPRNTNILVVQDIFYEKSFL